MKNNIPSDDFRTKSLPRSKLTPRSSSKLFLRCFPKLVAAILNCLIFNPVKAFNLAFDFIARLILTMFPPRRSTLLGGS